MNKITCLTSDILDKFNIVNAFTTRLGGVSEGCFESMNLKLTSNDNKNNIIKNYKIISDLLTINLKNCCLTGQTHSDNIIKIDNNNRNIYNFPNRSEDTDALITNLKEVPLFVFTADCVPILLYDSENHAIASIHSGWRGTVKQIAAKTILKMAEEYGSKPENIYAAIGPAICKDCFEINEEIYLLLKALTNDISCFSKSLNDKYFADLKNINKNILYSAGVPLKNIDVFSHCTKCNENFFSHRRMGENRGTQAAIICLK